MIPPANLSVARHVEKRALTKSPIFFLAEQINKFLLLPLLVTSLSLSSPLVFSLLPLLFFFIIAASLPFVTSSLFLRFNMKVFSARKRASSVAHKKPRLSIPDDHDTLLITEHEDGSFSWVSTKSEQQPLTPPATDDSDSDDYIDVEKVDEEVIVTKVVTVTTPAIPLPELPEPDATATAIILEPPKTPFYGLFYPSSVAAVTSPKTTFEPIVLTSPPTAIKPSVPAASSAPKPRAAARKQGNAYSASSSFIPDIFGYP